MEQLSNTLRDRPPFEIMRRAPKWLKGYLEKKKTVRNTFNTLGKIREHLYGDIYLDALKECRDKLNSVEVDRTRVKPVVKVTGEFWAQTTEGDGNFHMFEFLEREGAQVLVEPIATWVAYLMYQAKANAKRKWPVTRPHRSPQWYQVQKHVANQLVLRKKIAAISVGETLWYHFYHRVIENSAGSLTIWFRSPNWRAWRIPSTTNSRAAEKAISKSGRTSTIR